MNASIWTQFHFHPTMTDANYSAAPSPARASPIAFADHQLIDGTTTAPSEVDPKWWSAHAAHSGLTPGTSARCNRRSVAS